MDLHRLESPEPVRSGIFTYSKDGIKAGGYSRAPVSELRLLFRKNASKARIRAATRPWVTAQLQLYGIPFKKSESAIQLKTALETAVASGKCNSIVPSIAAVEKSLSGQYQHLLKAHTEQVDRWRTVEFSRLNSPTEEANFDLDRFMAKYFLDGLHGRPVPDKTKEALVLGSVNESAFEVAVRGIPGLATHITSRITVVGWEAAIQRGLDKAFLKLIDCGLHVPTSEANFDLRRFLAKYFLSSLDGKPAPRKTPDPISLYPFFKHHSRLRTAVASIPGLHLCDGYGMDGVVTTIIGWDVDKVKLQKRGIEEKAAKAEAARAADVQAEKEEERQHALQPHHKYMKSHQVATSPLTMDNLTGSFIVHCEKAEDYTRDCEVMTLDIGRPYNRHGTMAAFHFGLIEGTMLLALSDEALQLLRQEVEAIPDEEESDDWGFDGHENSRKRKAKETQAGQKPIKRRLGESPKPNRVHLQWAGKETGEGEIQVDTGNKHIGYLDFDASKASAQGVFTCPSYFGDEPLTFSMYKTMNQPSKIPDSWSSFTQKEYDYACLARWH